MTVREAAERLEVSVSLVYALIADGKLKCSRHGLGRGAIRISEQQLVDYISSAVVNRPHPATQSRPAFKHVKLP